MEDSDIILEILDARFPEDTRNPELEELVRDKRIIYVLNKADLLHKKSVEGRKFPNPFVFVSCKFRRGGKQLREKIKIEARKIKKSQVNVGVIGYPNTGKSSVINLLIGRTSAKTAAEAGFTKGIQKLKLTENIILFDTPGVIPRADVFHNQKLAYLGVKTYDKVKEPEIAVANLMARFPGLLEKFYDIQAENDSEKLIKELGKKKRFLVKGGEVDWDRTSRLILRDWQEGKIRV